MPQGRQRLAAIYIHCSLVGDTGVPVYCLSFGTTNVVEGAKLQSSVLVDLSYEMDAENSHRSGSKFFIAGLIRQGNNGQYDVTAGFGLIEYSLGRLQITRLLYFFPFMSPI